MTRLHRDVMRVLIGEITSGGYGPGEQLPREIDLAEQFSVSRGVARECIRGLEERGLIEVTHGRGAKVTPHTRWDVFDPDVLTSLLAGERGPAALRDYLECRRILELEAAALAAERSTPADVDRLTRAFEAMVESAPRAARNPAAEDLWSEADIEFHRAVVAAAQNDALGRMTEPIHRALATAMPKLARPQLRFQRALPEHKRILDAVATGDPTEARAAMHAHLDTVETYLREYTEEVADHARGEVAVASPGGR
jgi:DNA-binding FadR family transcriptional regulator